MAHRDFFAQADLHKHFLDALTAAHLPNSGLRWLVGNWPIPRLQLVPNSPESTIIVLSVASLSTKPFSSRNMFLPKGINISCIGKGQAVLIVTGAHLTHNLWSQITNPAMRKLQLVLSPEHIYTQYVHMHNTHAQSHTPEVLSLEGGRSRFYLPS